MAGVDENAPLMKRESSGVGHALKLGLGVVAAAGILVTGPLAFTSRGHGRSAQAASAGPASSSVLSEPSLTEEMAVPETAASSAAAQKAKLCVAHAAYGPEFQEIAAVTAQSKQAYADHNGYTFLNLVADSLDDFVGKYCPELKSQISLSFSYTTPVKQCGLQRALYGGDDLCDYVMWTDADAVIVDKEMKLEDLIFFEDKHGSRTANPNVEVADKYIAAKLGGMLNPAKVQQHEAFEPGRDMVFFLGKCDYKTPVPPGTCGSDTAFSNCVNTGAFILHKSPFALAYINDMLAFSMFDNKFLTGSECSTYDISPTFTDVNGVTHGWDQCAYPGETEQCTVACFYRQKPVLFKNTVCHMGPDQSTTLSGMLMVDYFDQSDAVKDAVVEWSLKNAIPGYFPLKQSYTGTLVFNCMGGTNALKLECAKRATDYWFPDPGRSAYADPVAVASRQVDAATSREDLKAAITDGREDQGRDDFDAHNPFANALGKWMFGLRR